MVNWNMQLKIFAYIFYNCLVFGRKFFFFHNLYDFGVFHSLRTAGKHDPLGLEAWLILQMWFGLLAGSGIHFPFTTHSPDWLNFIFFWVPLNSIFISYSHNSRCLSRKNTGYYYLKSLMFGVVCHFWCKEYHIDLVHTEERCKRGVFLNIYRKVTEQACLSEEIGTLV